MPLSPRRRPRGRQPGPPSCRRPWECRIRGRSAWPTRGGGCKPPTMRTPETARSPGKCRVRVIWPAPTIPMRISPELIDCPIVSALTINDGSGSSPVLILWSQGSGCDVEAPARPRNCRKVEPGTRPRVARSRPDEHQPRMAYVDSFRRPVPGIDRDAGRASRQAPPPPTSRRGQKGQDRNSHLHSRRHSRADNPHHQESAEATTGSNRPRDSGPPVRAPIPPTDTPASTSRGSPMPLS